MQTQETPEESIRGRGCQPSDESRDQIFAGFSFRESLAVSSLGSHDLAIMWDHAGALMDRPSPQGPTGSPANDAATPITPAATRPTITLCRRRTNHTNAAASIPAHLRSAGANSYSGTRWGSYLGVAADPYRPPPERVVRELPALLASRPLAGSTMVNRPRSHLAGSSVDR